MPRPPSAFVHSGWACAAASPTNAAEHDADHRDPAVGVHQQVRRDPTTL